ncbi:TPA: hypothetical protein DIV48_03595 [Candidatus Kaiserbacteria bacterium]|nr:hypothetical protein [Candidatus Kaiserbacteria bacterium]
MTAVLFWIHGIVVCWIVLLAFVGLAVWANPPVITKMTVMALSDAVWWAVALAVADLLRWKLKDVAWITFFGVAMAFAIGLYNRGMYVRIAFPDLLPVAVLYWALAVLSVIAAVWFFCLQLRHLESILEMRRRTNQGPQ